MFPSFILSLKLEKQRRTGLSIIVLLNEMHQWTTATMDGGTDGWLEMSVGRWI